MSLNQRSVEELTASHGCSRTRSLMEKTKQQAYADRLSVSPLPQASAFQMVRRRAVAAKVVTAISNHSFRATGIIAYLKNDGTLERAATMANHASARTTQFYDRRPDDVTLDEVERVLI